jgi:MoaA/NifB/PqqE/SkfB family radical SAM enzyme
MDLMNKNDKHEGITYSLSNNEKISIVYTYYCPISCSHCLAKCSPLTNEKLSLNTAKEILKIGANFDKKFVFLEGGEILSFWEETKELVKFASEYGYISSISTNCFWAKSYNKTIQKLIELKDLGLHSIFPSADFFHQQFIPIEYPLNVIKASEKLNINCEINYYLSKNIEIDAVIYKKLNLKERGYFCDNLSGYGRNIEEHLFRYKKKRIIDFEDNSAFIITFTPEQQVIFNCEVTRDNNVFLNTPLYVGKFDLNNINDLYSDSSKNNLLTALSELSPSMFINHLREFVNPFIYNKIMEQSYYTYTEAIIDIFKMIHIPDLIHYFNMNKL